MAATATHLTGRIDAIVSQIPDPEIPAVSLADLGIIRGVEEDGAGGAQVIITPTYTGCPATLAIRSSIRLALDTAGLSGVGIATRLSPPWTTDWITQSGREKLRAYGIAPPEPGGAGGSLKALGPATCPRCGSARTEEVSRFGSTPCKALWRCLACQEPFDRFKCI